MRDVGNVDAQRHRAVRAVGQADGVVIVAGVVGVDGDDGLGREVAAAGQGLLVDAAGGAAGLVQGGLGELVRQVELADDRQRVHARVAPVPQDLGDDRLARLAPQAVRDDLEDDLVLGAGAGAGGVGDGEVVEQDVAVGPDHGPGVGLEHRADERQVAALFHLEEPPVVPAVALALDLGQNGVAGDGVAGGAGWDEEVFAGGGPVLVGGFDEAEAALRQAEAALDGAVAGPAGGFLGGPLAGQLQVAADRLDLALADELLHERPEGGVVLLGHVEEAGQPPQPHRPVMVRLHVGQDSVACGHGDSLSRVLWKVLV